MSTSPIAEFVAGSLTDAFSRRFAQPVEASAGVAAEDEMAVLVVNRLADMALGPMLTDKELVSEPVFRSHMVAVASPHDSLKGRASGWPWLVDPSGIDPSSDMSRPAAGLSTRPLGKLGHGRPSAGLRPESRRSCAPRPAQETVGTGNSPDQCRAVRNARLLPKRGRKASHIGSLRRCPPVIRAGNPLTDEQRLLLAARVDVALEAP